MNVLYVEVLEMNIKFDQELVVKFEVDYEMVLLMNKDFDCDCEEQCCLVEQVWCEYEECIKCEVVE